MSWSTITKPATGNATKKSLADAIIDDLTYLYGQLASTTGDKASIVNGSFEIDGDADGVPDGWTKSDFTGGVLSITGNGLADANCYSGARAIKYVHPGGASNGGGTITSTEFEVSPSKTYAFSWVTYSTAAGLVNITYIEWFTAAKTLISTTTLETLSANNPSAWSQQGSVAVPPSTARFAKLKFSLGDSSGSTGGSVYLDAVSVSVIDLSRFVEFEGAGSTATTYTWTCRLESVLFWLRLGVVEDLVGRLDPLAQDLLSAVAAADPASMCGAGSKSFLGPITRSALEDLKMTPHSRVPPL